MKLADMKIELPKWRIAETKIAEMKIQRTGVDGADQKAERPEPACSRCPNRIAEMKNQQK